ncbi:MAG: SxtJ family membrane protein [Bacteroidia bacterium]
MSKEKQIQTILAIATGLIAFHFYTNNKWLLISGFVCLLIGLFSDFLTEKIAFLWLKLAEILGNINGKIILSLLFFLILTPMALLARLFGNKNLNLQKSNESHYTERNHLYEAKDLENMW